jgi:hypothetical protein
LWGVRDRAGGSGSARRLVRTQGAGAVRKAGKGQGQAARRERRRQRAQATESAGDRERRRRAAVAARTIGAAHSERCEQQEGQLLGRHLDLRGSRGRSRQGVCATPGLASPRMVQATAPRADHALAARDHGGGRWIKSVRGRRRSRVRWRRATDAGWHMGTPMVPSGGKQAAPSPGSSRCWWRAARWVEAEAGNARKRP